MVGEIVKIFRLSAGRNGNGAWASQPEFAVFAKLRDLRKEIAQAEGVPVYAIFNNMHLAQMVQKKVRTKSDLEAVTGVGDARSEKYGSRFLEVLTKEWGGGNEADGESV